MFKRIAVLILLLPGSTACYTWHQESLSPIAVIAERAPSPMRATLRDGRSFVLYQPQLRETWVQGHTQGGSLVTFPLSDLRVAETRRVSGLKTTGVVLGAVGTAGVGVFVLSHALLQHAVWHLLTGQ